MSNDAIRDALAACKHPRIVTYAIADDGPDHGQPAGLWACEVCKHKFVPLDLEMEARAALAEKPATEARAALARPGPLSDWDIVEINDQWGNTRGSTIADLIRTVERLVIERMSTRCADIVRNADKHGCACSDRDALADLIEGRAT